MGRFQTLALFGVDNDDIGEDLREFLGVEKLGGFLLVACVVNVKGLCIVLKHLLELTNVTRHVKGWRVNEEDWLASFVVGIFEFAAEFLKVRIESKLYIESS